GARVGIAGGPALSAAAPRGLVVIPEVRELLIRERAPFEVIGPRGRSRAGVRGGESYSVSAARPRRVRPSRRLVPRDRLARDREARPVTAAAADRPLRSRRDGRRQDRGAGSQLPDWRHPSVRTSVRTPRLSRSRIRREAAINMPMGAYVRVERPAIMPLARAA